MLSFKYKLSFNNREIVLLVNISKSNIFFICLKKKNINRILTFFDKQFMKHMKHNTFFKKIEEGTVNPKIYNIKRVSKLWKIQKKKTVFI